MVGHSVGFYPTVRGATPTHVQSNSASKPHPATQPKENPQKDPFKGVQ